MNEPRTTGTCALHFHRIWDTTQPPAFLELEFRAASQQDKRVTPEEMLWELEAEIRAVVAPYQSDVGIGSPSNACTGIGAGGTTSMRSAST